MATKNKRKKKPHKRNGTHKNRKRLPYKLKQGDVVLLTQARVGVVRYIGAVDGISQSGDDHLIGIEIRITDGPVGDNNGTYNQKTYFKCNKDCGLFIQPQQIIQVYSPEDLLQMIIGLKDKLLPLMARKQTVKSPIKTSSPITTNRPRNISNGSWPSNNAPTMSYIKEEETVHFNVQINRPNTNSNTKPMHGIYWSGSNTNLKDFNKLSAHQMKKSTMSAAFDSVDMNIAAPRGLMNFFENGGSIGGNGSISPVSMGGPFSPIGNKHLNMKSRVSFLRAAHNSQNTSSLGGGAMIASYQKLKLLHRCVTLRRKANNSNKKSLVLDLAHFGLFLVNEQISDKHKWYERIWNKYDKLFKFKIEFYFVNELLTDLLNEYLQNEYEVRADNIMTVDVKKAVQQIIIHIRPYHIEQHQQSESPFPDSESVDMSTVSDEDEMPFTFGDFCSLGAWLHEIEEMEEDDDFEEDYFMMDIHYWDFVQYINSHKHHIWKKVIHTLVSKGKSKQIIHKFSKSKMTQVLKGCLCDYGRNGLGNVNMEIYDQQITEYTKHLRKLYNEYNHAQQAQISGNEGKNHKNMSKKGKNFVTKKEFFEFVSCIPSL